MTGRQEGLLQIIRRNTRLSTNALISRSVTHRIAHFLEVWVFAIAYMFVEHELGFGRLLRTS